MEPTAYRQFAELERTHWWFRGRRAVFRSLLEATIAPKGSGLALDVGSGYGGMFECLAPFGSVVALDVAAGALGHCVERGFRGAVAGSGYALPFREGAFDLVALFDTLEHCDDDGAVVAECRRVLRPGGALVVTGPAYGFLYAQNDRIAHHRRRYTVRGLRRLLESRGLRVVRATYVNALLFPFILPAVLALKAKETILGADGKKTNLSYRLPRPLNEAFAAIFRFERRLVPRLSLPAGHSLALVARRADGS